MIITTTEQAPPSSKQSCRSCNLDSAPRKRSGLLTEAGATCRQAKVFKTPVLLQVINELSEGLVLKVLRACKQPFFRHLAVLPADLHEAALHACFPHILASATLHIEPVKAQSEIDTLSKFLPQLLHLKSLQVIGVPGQHRYDADVLAGKVLQLTELQRLDFKSVRLCVKQVGSEACLDLDFWQLPHLTWLTMSDISSQRHVCISGLGTGLHKLQKHYRLHHLDVSRNMYSSTESQSIADAICGFTSLRSLNLNGTNVFPDAEGVCIQGTNLWSLEKLELSGRWAKSEGAADFLSHIGNMSALKYLNLDCQPFHSSSFHPFISSFTGLSSLTCLSLINSSLAIDQISRLATEIDQLSALQELYLENCHIDSVVWEMFAQARSRGVKVRHRLGDS